MSTETVYLAVYDTLADWETGFAMAHIGNPQFQQQPGRYQVMTVGETSAPVTTLGGMRIVPDRTLAEVRAEDSAMLVLPGATGWENGELLAFRHKAREFLDAGVPVAAICGAVFGLACEGLLDDRDHTGAAAEVLAASGYQGSARYRDEPAVSDGNLITAGPTAPLEFAREILARLELYKPAALDAWYRLYDSSDTGAYYDLMAAAG